MRFASHLISGLGVYTYAIVPQEGNLLAHLYITVSNRMENYMKNLKTAVWIILLVLIQSAADMCIKAPCVTIPLIIPFAAAVSFLEDGFGYAALIGIICGILQGTFFGPSFTVSVAVTAAFTLAILNFRNRPRYASDFIKLPVWTFLAVFAEGAISYPAAETIPYVAVNSAVGAVVSVLLYVLLKKTVYKSNYKTFTL